MQCLRLGVRGWPPFGLGASLFGTDFNQVIEKRRRRFRSWKTPAVLSLPDGWQPVRSLAHRPSAREGSKEGALLGAREAGECRGSFKGPSSEHPDRSLALSGLSSVSLSLKRVLVPKVFALGQYSLNP